MSKVTRRKFMLALGAGSAGAVAVALTKNKAGEEKQTTAATDSKAAGYQATAHVRNYYRTTRV